MNDEIARFRLSLDAGNAPDVAGLHTAVFTWGLARAARGDLVLVLDDTSGSSQPDDFLEALRWLGIDWDEGPEAGGELGPHLRSQRLTRYREVAEQLQAAGYTVEANGVGDPALTFQPSPEGETTIDDAIRGSRRVAHTALAPLPLLDAQGRPGPVFAAVVDDHDMQATHAVLAARDEATLPHRSLLFHLLGWNQPIWATLPEVIGGSAGEGSTFFDRLQEAGYLPQAVFNYLLLLGWSPAETMLNRWDVRRQLSLDAIETGPVTFEWERLDQFNRRYLQQHSDARLTEMARPFLEDAYELYGINEAWLERLVGIVRGEMVRLADVVPLAEWALSDLFDFNEAAEAALADEATAPVLVQLVAELAHVVVLDEPTAGNILDGMQRRFQASLGWDRAQVERPVRAALTGTVDGPPLAAIMALLGAQRCMNRAAEILRNR